MYSIILYLLHNCLFIHLFLILSISLKQHLSLKRDGIKTIHNYNNYNVVCIAMPAGHIPSVCSHQVRRSEQSREGCGATDRRH